MTKYRITIILFTHKVLTKAGLKEYFTLNGFEYVLSYEKGGRVMRLLPPDIEAMEEIQ